MNSTLPLMREVDSRCLLYVGYDEVSQVLYLRFRRGRGVYTYFNVPVEIYCGLMAARSKGAYFATHIRHQYGRS